MKNDELAKKIKELTNMVSSSEFEVNIFDEVKNDSYQMPDSIKKKVFWLLNKMGIETISCGFEIYSDEGCEGELNNYQLNLIRFSDQAEMFESKEKIKDRFTDEIWDLLEELCIAPMEVISKARNCNSSGSITYEPAKMLIKVEENIDTNESESFDEVVWSKEDE